MAISVIYSDINLNADTSTKEIVQNIDSINQNIAAIFDTLPGTKWFRENIGCDINALLFEPIDHITAGAIKTEISSALAKNGESRVIFKEVEVLADPSNSQYYVKIVYDIPTLTVYNYKFTFNLIRGTY